MLLCPECGNVLGEVVKGNVVKQRHKGRLTVGTPIVIFCERCNAMWTAPPAVLKRFVHLIQGLAAPLLPPPREPRPPVLPHAA